MFDLIVRAGMVIDGSGGPARRADVGIRGGRVAGIGDLRGQLAEAEIDAQGCVVAPGFVDIHTHYDPHVLWNPQLTPSSLHGVTTVVGGNCGFSLAPISDTAAEYLIPMLARVEGMPLDALERGVDLRWSSVAQWLDHVQGATALNIGFLAGHSAIRRVVMGERAVGEKATSQDLDAMCRLLDVSLGEGALGFSSSWGVAHSDHRGDPVPSRWADREELLSLCEVVSRHEGTVLEFIPDVGDGWTDRTDDLLVEMSLTGRRSVNWNVLRVGSTEEEQDRTLRRLRSADVARERGATVVPLAMLDPFRLRLSFDSGFVLDSMKGWADLFKLPLSDRLTALSDPAMRQRLREGASASVQEVWNDWPRYRVERVGAPSLLSLQGRSIGQIAAERSCDPFGCLLDVVVEDRGETLFEAPPRDDGEEAWQRRGELLHDERVVLGGSDAGAHLDMITTFACHTRLLAEAVRRRRLVGLEQAVRLMTDVPARLYGLHRRGRLLPGWWADVVVFDPEVVGPGEVEFVSDLPGGAGRLFSTATGIHHVVVNGVEVARHGAPIGTCPGRVLRSGRDTVTVPIGRLGAGHGTAS
ncbi:MAG: amidohydrolase family protein [Acidimicrobiia bacterium]